MRSRHEVLMAAAVLYEAQSTCERNKVGAVIAVEGRIISTGYNGTPAGMPHCDHTCSCMGQLVHEDFHSDGCLAKNPCRGAVHAEANAVAFAARYGLKTDGATIYTTLSPCLPCSQLIINAGLHFVLYRREYRDRAGVELLKAAGVGVGPYDSGKQ